jgi:hypothetical protein
LNNKNIPTWEVYFSVQIRGEKRKNLLCIPTHIHPCSHSPSDSARATWMDAGWGDERRERKRQ